MKTSKNVEKNTIRVKIARHASYMNSYTSVSFFNLCYPAMFDESWQLKVRLCWTPSGHCGQTIIFIHDTSIHYVFYWSATAAIERSAGFVFNCRVDFRPMDCDFHPSLKQRYMYVLVHPRTNDPVHQCYSLGTLKSLVCQVWWALQYLALWATNRN